ncbi:uncharacterized protein BX663DRAFT_513637 [Cokeromyces recurvatus]|uniref:uncharacterized protein n=1 Tax=Cokeromyces recurvatus TaxID=90255 RepID=UPI00221F7467|nr:uncharacterized protein BX663DRAFT_513637 [Cokeromyces recurvatus]KAI7901671.1 hypothetical protein BX663DRAFT_513637 [Cokeromyces recurvatus]
MYIYIESYVICVIVAPPNIGWSAINFDKLEIRVIAVAVVVMIGNTGGIVASYLYPISSGPNYCKCPLYYCSLLLTCLYMHIYYFLLNTYKQRFWKYI